MEFTYETKSPPGEMRPDAYGIVTAYGSPHLARKAEQVPQGLRDIGSSKRTCPLCSKRASEGTGRMTIQEQLQKINQMFVNAHREFTNLETEKQNLKIKQEDLSAKARMRFQQEKQTFQDIREEVLKYYRIAKDNSGKELLTRSAVPVKPDLGKLNTMIEQVMINDRNDLTAGRIIDLASSYCAYLDIEIDKIDAAEQRELHRIRESLKQEAAEIDRKKKQILATCVQFLQSGTMKKLQELFDRIQRDYEITPDFPEKWNQTGVQKKKLLLGYSWYHVDIPRAMKRVMKDSLGRHYDEDTNSIHCPCGVDSYGREGIFVEYTDFNADKMKKGIQAIVLNVMRHFPAGSLRITLFDYVHYNAEILGPLSVFADQKKGMIERVPHDAGTLKQEISMLAEYYRKVEQKLRADDLSGYNSRHAQNEQIPRRLLIINRSEEAFHVSEEAEMSYIVNNARKFGITVIRMTKSLTGGSKGTDREKRYLLKAKDLIRIISDQKGNFYIENDVEWMSFQWLTAPDHLPEKFVKTMMDSLMPVEIGTGYFRRYQPAMPARSEGIRKPVTVPFAVNENDHAVECSFENELFAAYMMGASRSGKSTLLHTIISGLIMNYHPDELELWLLDFKMVEFKRYADHRPPHVKYLLLEKSEDLVFDIVDQMEKTLTEREHLFARNNWQKLADVPPDVYMPVIFVIIDEFAQMSQILKETKGTGYGTDYTLKLTNLLQKGAALGFKFIFSSQNYSDGVEGLTEAAKKQIQQRVALKNTYQEIRDTLALSGDVVTNELKNHMNTLPPYESLFKWRTKEGNLRVDHLRNMYTEKREVEELVDAMNRRFHAESRENRSDPWSYREKNPVLIDGGEPKTFASQASLYQSYETSQLLEEMEDNDVFIYPGVPCSFNPVKPFLLVNGISENILITGCSRESGVSILLSVLKSYFRKCGRAEIWAHNRDSLYKRYREKIFGKIPSQTDLGKICHSITEIKQQIQEARMENKLILVLGYEKIAADMEILGSDSEKESVRTKTPAMEKPEDMASVLEKIKACADPAEKKRILEDYNARVAAWQNQSAAEPKEEETIFDARKDLQWVIRRAPNYGIHFLFVFERAGDYVDTRLDPRAFQHKIVFPMTKEDSINILGNRKANEIAKDCCAYSNGRTFFTIRPHIYRGVPRDGWQVDENGQVVQRG